MKKFWNFKKVTNSEAEERVLELNGTIAEESWFDDEITPRMFKEELLSGSGPLTVWINSPGGDCIAASQIYSMLIDYKDDVTVKVDGIAASAASVIAMAGTKVLLAPTALMMIHNPAMGVFGDHNDMDKAKAVLEEVKESIINAYAIKTGKSRALLSKLMESETWMNANKAIELGFANGILERESNEVVPSDAYMFGAKEFDMALVNKISDKSKDEPTSKKGRNVSELKDKLVTIKKFI